MTGGGLRIDSEARKEGTTVTAEFIPMWILSPLGTSTRRSALLITCNTDRDFVFHHRIDDREFTLDTRELGGILGEKWAERARCCGHGCGTFSRNKQKASKGRKYSMKSLAELQAIRDKARGKVRCGKDRTTRSAYWSAWHLRYRCGRTPVLTTIVDEVAKRGLQNVMVTQTGCIGICQLSRLSRLWNPARTRSPM